MMNKNDTSVTMNNFNSTTTLASNEVIYPVQSKESLNDDYNPFDHRVVEHPTSTIGSLIHILKSSLGTGILSMPNAFKNAGMLFGLLGTLSVGYLCSYCIYILVDASHVLCKKSKVPSLGLSDTCAAAFEHGPKQLRKYSTGVKIIVDVALVVTYFMGLCVYVVFISESIGQLVEYWYPNVNLSTRAYMAMLLLPLLVSTQVRELKYLIPFSFFANVFLILSFGTTLYYVFVDLPSPSTRPMFTSFSMLPSFFSIVIFAMEGVGVILPVENSMKHPERFLGYCGVLNVAMGSVVLIYTTIGFFGYLKYGDETLASITLNLPVEEIPAQCVKLLIILSVYLTYHLQMYVPFEVIWKTLISPKVEGRLKRNLAQIAVRCLFVIGTVVIAAVVPNLEPIISLVGSICLTSLGILLPAVVDTTLHWEDFGCLKWKLTKNVFLMLFALLALVLGSITSIRHLIHDYN